MTLPSSALSRLARPGLALRLAFILSLAILPLGLISVLQTGKVIEERQSLSAAALLEETQRAVSVTRDMIRAAEDTAQTLRLTLPDLRDTPGTCTAVLTRIAENSPDFVFVGFVDGDMGVTCSSRGAFVLDGPVSNNPDLLARQPGIFVSTVEFLAGRATLNVTVPVMSEDGFAGAVWIAVPLVNLNQALAETAPDVDLVLFRPDGAVLATEQLSDDRRLVLPRDRTLAALATEGRQAFRAENREGMERDFAVAPIVEGAVLVLGSWAPRHHGLVLSTYAEAIALYFPFAIWIIAVLVAYVGVHRLVIRHVRRLRSWMRLYAQGQIDFSRARLDNPPLELEEVADAFRAMTERLSEQDRHRQEDLEEKTVLLREVHHRVKNNLQLISSMMNIQIRATGNPVAKHLLRRIQDRVMALSAIHRYLYMARKLSMVRADTLLADIIQQQVAVGTLEEAGHHIRVSTQLDPIEVNPDQSVPLSLLVAEAAVNAVKHSGADQDPGGGWIDIALKKVDNGMVTLSVVNSRNEAEDGSAEDPPDGTGLGSRLIQTFAAQLNGTIETSETPERYELHVTFPLAWHDSDPDQ
ncbi:MAG: HAMP domain-containing protein [Rhodobacteraceae bacterium]|nr:MAG: HAMP domain-containing protein [Paracoccaceae bacterium]